MVKNLCYSFSSFALSLARRIQRTNRLRILLILPSPFCQKIQRINRLRILLILSLPFKKIFQRTNRLRYLLFPLTKIQGINCLRILCLNTLEGTFFVVQVEGIYIWIVILRTREGTSLVDQFKWRVHPLGCSKRTREDTSLVDLCL